MELWLIWLILGFVLVTIELATGTFYLLVLGLGAFAGALATWAGANVLLQAVIAAVISLLGAWAVHHWHARNRGTAAEAMAGNFLDRGQPVVLESWVDERHGLARVKYRGASWDARVAAPAAQLALGSTLYIEGQEGSMLLAAVLPPVAT